MLISDLFSSRAPGCLKRAGHATRAAKQVILSLGVFLIPALALAQDSSRGEAGQFDYFVLALSWSPSYCQAAQERGRRRPADEQCSGRPFAFVVHGLWPQYERGFPSYCQVPAPRLNRRLVTSMLDLMPSAGLIFHEWQRHGTCSGLDPAAFFQTVRKAYASVNVP